MFRECAARKFGLCCDLTTSEFNYATQSEINIIDKPQGQRQKKTTEKNTTEKNIKQEKNNRKKR